MILALRPAADTGRIFTTGFGDHQHSTWRGLTSRGTESALKRRGFLASCTREGGVIEATSIVLPLLFSSYRIVEGDMGRPRALFHSGLPVAGRPFANERIPNAICEPRLPIGFLWRTPWRNPARSSQFRQKKVPVEHQLRSLLRHRPTRIKFPYGQSKHFGANCGNRR